MSDTTNTSTDYTTWTVAQLRTECKHLQIKLSRKDEQTGRWRDLRKNEMIEELRLIDAILNQVNEEDQDEEQTTDYYYDRYAMGSINSPIEKEDITEEELVEDIMDAGWFEPYEKTPDNVAEVLDDTLSSRYDDYIQNECIGEIPNPRPSFKYVGENDDWESVMLPNVSDAKGYARRSRKILGYHNVRREPGSRVVSVRYV